MTSKIIDANARGKVWTIIEKVIAVILLLWGIYSLYNLISYIADMINTGYVNSIGKSYWQLAADNYLGVLASLACIFAGFLLLTADRMGWILSLMASAASAVSFFMSSRSNAIHDKLQFSEFYKSYGITALVFIAIFFLLLLKPFREKYLPTSKTWLWIFGIILLFIINKLILWQ